MQTETLRLRSTPSRMAKTKNMLTFLSKGSTCS